MRNVMTALALLLAAPQALRAEVSKEDVRKLCAAGISDSIIVSYVRANAPLQSLTAADLVDLRRAGASDALLSSLLGLATASAAPAADLTPQAPVSDVYSIPAPDQPTALYNDYYPADLYAPTYSTYCVPSFGVGLDLCGGLYSGCAYVNRCNRWYGGYGGYRSRGYGSHYVNPCPAPVNRGAPSSGHLGSVGPYRGPIGGVYSAGARANAAVSGGFHVGGQHVGSRPSPGYAGTHSGGGHYGGGGGHSGGGHSGGGHGGHR